MSDVMTKNYSPKDEEKELTWANKICQLERKCKISVGLFDTLIDRVAVLEKELGIAISSLPKNLEDRISNLEEKLKKR